MRDTVWELSCNLDDMTPEDVAYAMERLLEEGGLDVWTTPIGMKKNRPGVMLSVLCAEGKKEDMVKSLFFHTTTLGIRVTEHTRYILRREFTQVDTPWGPVGIKTAGDRFKPEFEDLRTIALRENLPIAQVRQAAERAYDRKMEQEDMEGNLGK